MKSISSQYYMHQCNIGHGRIRHICLRMVDCKHNSNNNNNERKNASMEMRDETKRSREQQQQMLYCAWCDCIAFQCHHQLWFNDDTLLGCIDFTWRHINALSATSRLGGCVRVVEPPVSTRITHTHVHVVQTVHAVRIMLHIASYTLENM